MATKKEIQSLIQEITEEKISEIEDKKKELIKRFEDRLPQIDLEKFSRDVIKKMKAVLDKELKGTGYEYHSRYSYSGWSSSLNSSYFRQIKEYDKYTTVELEKLDKEIEKVKEDAKKLGRIIIIKGIKDDSVTDLLTKFIGEDA